MRVIYFLLPILIASLFACKNKQQPIPDLRFSVFDKADSFYNINKYDSAFYYYNTIANDSTDSLQVATAYISMGLIQNLEGDYYGAQESFVTSLPYLDERQQAHRYCLQSAYHELAVSNQHLKKYNEAIDYSQKALAFAVDNEYRIRMLNSLALTYQKKGDYLQADSLYLIIIDSIKSNPKEYARVLSNQARTRWLQDHHYPAGPSLLQALSIREKLKDKWGLNASYAHLADYYTDTRPDSALYYALKRDTIAQELNSSDDTLEALVKLLNLSPSPQVKPYFIRYQYLIDSLQTAHNAAKNQFALIRYETEKSKADNLQLQKDKARQQVAFWSAISFFIVVAIIALIWYRKRKQQLEAASRLALQAQEIKTSQKVHDVVANGLYRMMADIQHKETIDKGPLLDNIEDLYERSRNISYEPQKVPHQDFQNTISGMLKAFGNSSTNVYVTGNSQSLWDRITPRAQQEVEQVLQELMVNMKKHSRAENVVVKFEARENCILIHYKDDGVGLPSGFKYGNGLTSTETRIKGIGGDFTFEEITKGLKILISIPTVPIL
ncbi:ATP-binding protein [Paraflavitalea soli]|uniref:histidine kinase n=1 Tax=Paraflavitalea soli TaxID=2315862 RepID=A0A3B7MGW2_9BACT|nr:tetratricopeptide repeat-containing sensor histidine kinase [Paraflavitalea soli]AXY73614.1 ATP-binding protein [Paraflavitalea soli]